MRFTDIIVHERSERVTQRKIDMRPFGGWPGGVDPYPGVPDEEVVVTSVFYTHWTMEARQIGGDPLPFGSKFTLEKAFCHDPIAPGLEGREFVVTKTGGGFIEAVSFPKIPA